MALPKCPVCGGEAVDLYQRKTHSNRQSTDKSDAEVVVCHCIESHRFVVADGDRRVSARHSQSFFVIRHVIHLEN
jgi:hypothetical protein